MPSFIRFSASALHDQQFHNYINELPDNSIITFDKAYINYGQFDDFTDLGITYVLPQKDNANYTCIKENELLETEPNILKDEIIEVLSTIEVDWIEVKKSMQIRRVAYYSEKHKATFVYQTNNFELKAMEVVEIYTYIGK